MLKKQPSLSPEELEGGRGKGDAASGTPRVGIAGGIKGNQKRLGDVGQQG